jgi:hypothetical protein
MGMQTGETEPKCHRTCRTFSTAGCSTLRVSNKDVRGVKRGAGMEQAGVEARVTCRHSSVCVCETGRGVKRRGDGMATSHC